MDIDDDLVKELLDNGMFADLVPTPLYPAAINYIVSGSSEEYSVSWAVAELTKRNYVAEAGQLQLLAMGVPAALRGFTQSVLYCKSLLRK